MNNKSIGRLQLSLTDLLKTDLAKCLEKNFPVRAPPVEQRSVDPPRREIEENQTESSASTSDKEATAPTLQEQSSQEMAESEANWDDSSVPKHITYLLLTQSMRMHWPGFSKTVMTN
jgi:hypothetical protein